MSTEFRKNFIEEIKLKTIYISKYDTVKDLKEKIYRSYGNLLEKNSQRMINKDDINNNIKPLEDNKACYKDFNLLQMYNGKGNGKRLLVNLIYHYKIYAKSFRVPGKFLTENDTKLEVKLTTNLT